MLNVEMASLQASCVSIQQWEDVVQSNLKKSFNKYEGVSSSNEISVGWDLMFIGVSLVHTA